MAKIFLKKLVRQIYYKRSYMLYAARCQQLPENMSLDGEEYYILQADSSRGPWMGKSMQLILAMNEENAAYLTDVAQRRAIALLVCYQGKPVHYAFVLLKNRMRCLLGLPPSAALLAHAFTAAEYRGKGCQARSAKKRAEAAEAAGYSMVYAETAIDNRASQHGLEKAGMEALGIIEIVCLLRFIIIRPKRPSGFPAISVCW